MLPNGWDTAADATQFQKIQYCSLPPAGFDGKCFIRNVVTTRGLAKFTLAKCGMQFFYSKGRTRNVLAASSACTNALHSTAHTSKARTTEIICIDICCMLEMRLPLMQTMLLIARSGKRAGRKIGCHFADVVPETASHPARCNSNG